MNTPNSQVLDVFPKHTGKGYRELEEWGQDITQPFFVIFIHCHTRFTSLPDIWVTEPSEYISLSPQRQDQALTPDQETELHCLVGSLSLLLQSG